MRIDPSPAPRPQGQMQPKRDDVDRRSPDRSSTWRAILDGTALFRTIDPLPTTQQVFAASSAIGDAAVRFDARPIVAPAAEADQTADADRPGDAGPQAETVIRGLEVAVACAGSANAMPPSDAIGPSTPAAPSHNVASLAPGQQVAPVRFDGSTGALPSAAPRACSTTVAKPVALRAPRAPFSGAAHEVGARVIAFADEIRVVVQGTVLSAEDRTALVQVAEATLAGTAHAGRSIRIIGRRSGT